MNRDLGSSSRKVHFWKFSFVKLIWNVQYIQTDDQKCLESEHYNYKAYNNEYSVHKLYFIIATGLFNQFSYLGTLQHVASYAKDGNSSVR